MSRHERGLVAVKSSVGGRLAVDGEVPSDRAVVLAPMRPRHVRGVTAIERAVSARPWSEQLFRAELRRPDTNFYLVALDASRVVGFAGAMLVADEAHITNVAVDPGRRREGIALALVRSLLSDCVAAGSSCATLEVRVSNRGAQRLYHRFGFAPAGVRPAYYRDNGEDALIMWSHDVTERLEAMGGERAAAPAGDDRQNGLDDD